MLFFLGIFLFFIGLEGCKRTLSLIGDRFINNLTGVLNENFFLSILIGTFVTGIIQSSSAVSVIVIALCEAGILGFKPALGIIMGANIGTTFTVQLISLPIISYYYYLLIIAAVFIMLSFLSYDFFMRTGLILLFFGIVFMGLNYMIIFFKQPEINTKIVWLLSYCNHKVIYGILLGATITAIIQSSSIVTGITVSLAYNNILTLPVAISIALGSNIGTCFTAFLASVNSGESAKSLAIGHFIFNLMGVIIIFPFLDSFTSLVSLSSGSLTRQIANAHTIFNIFNLIIFLPFINTFVSILRRNQIVDN